MVTTHDPNVTVAVTLDSPPAAGPEFQVPLLAVPLATNSLDGDRVRSYAESADVTDDETAGFISATTAAQLSAALSQSNRPRPPIVKAGYVDLVGGETYATALALIRAADPGFYGYAIQEHTDGAIAEAVGVAIEAEGEALFMFQSDSADWLTSGVPAAYADLVDLERCAGVYHDVTTAALDFAALGAGLQDPDSFSAPWTMNVGGVAAYTTPLTTGQRLLAIANDINVFGEFGESSTWLDAGVNMAGRTLRVNIMKDWLRARLRERTYSYIITKSNQLQAVGVTPGHQVDVGGILKQLIEEGSAKGHFVRGEVTYPANTATDLILRRVRVQGSIDYLVDGRIVSFTVDLTAGA